MYSGCFSEQGVKTEKGQYRGKRLTIQDKAEKNCLYTESGESLEMRLVQESGAEIKDQS